MVTYCEWILFHLTPNPKMAIIDKETNIPVVQRKNAQLMMLIR